MNIRRIAPVCVLLAGLCMTNAALAQNGSQNKKERQAQTQPSAKLKVGSNAPALSVKTWVKGAPISKLENGKAYVVEFWATWCPPCVAELPNVLKAYEKYHAKGFEIIGISLDKDEAALTSFIKKKNMPWPQYFDGLGWNNKLSGKYGVTSIPATYLLDGEGKIIGSDLRGDALDEAIAKALAKK